MTGGGPGAGGPEMGVPVAGDGLGPVNAVAGGGPGAGVPVAGGGSGVAGAGPVPSYVHGTGDTALLGDTIGGNLDRTVAAFPDREALVDVPSGRRWTYAEFGADVDTLARALLGRGVAKGDRVGIWAVNCPEWVLVQYATARIGAIMVTINPAYRAHEVAFVLNQSRISVLFASPGHRSSDYRALVEQVRGECPGLRSVHYFGDPGWDRLLAEGGRVAAEEVAARAAGLSCDDPINIQYTSGTTGFPKGATLSHHNILNNGYFVGETVGYTEQDRICLPVPFYHCFGMVMGNLGATSHGACVVIPAPSFDAAATLDAVQRERCTSLYGVPTMFLAELDLPGFTTYDLTSLRTGIMAGSPCPVEVMKRVVERMNMREVSICYGMTETSPVSLQTRRDDDLERRTGTVGRALPHIEVKVIDPATGVTVGRGTPGELCTRGYSVMLGYWDEPALTAEVVDAGRWMHTGDLAVIREDGYAQIVGRIKDLIIRGGENVYPREIEEFLYGHPQVADIQVVGVPDERYGEEIVACVIPRDPAAPPSAEEIRAYCRERLAHYKIPRRVEIVDGFPMTVSGKVRKVELRERFSA
ncbi:AMP-binding protein [Streptomyces sp. NPDC093085]|uniref:AMP-binding protein n=1 Tax=Streptomyces sp. NPDC093085 TaxID=3155068 RepID=UPI0034137768